MLDTLYARLAAVLVGVLVAIGLLYAFISTSMTRDYLQTRTQRFNRDLARHIVADRDLVAAGRLDQQALRDTFHMYMSINPSIEIYLLDTGGRILAYSADPGKVLRERVDLAPVRAFLQGADFPLLGDDPRSADRQKAFSVTPVPSGEAPEGYLYVVLRGEEFDAVASRELGGYLLRLSAWAVVASLGFGLVAGLLLFFVLTRRVQRLAHALEEFQRNGFSDPAPYAAAPAAAGDEIGRLGLAFNRMAERIVSQVRRLKEQDELRRDLVAQVSHDLRTPLASLQGYIETLRMKSSELDEATRAEYLGIAMRQSVRLTRLVEELFELARLEAEKTRPRREQFSAAELVQDVAQKFQVNARRKGVQLAMTPPSGVCSATADIALTERVLDNLIGNAIEHTPATGRVQLTVSADNGRVAVSVADTGPGIGAEDLPRIFEPFYRASQRPAGDGHAGLGLAISRRIVELQGGELLASSEAGRGAVFTFTLPT